MELTQAQYKLFTGQTIAVSAEDWTTIVKVASIRLASFLCLEQLPELTDDNLDLAQLLANFIAAVQRFQGDGGTVSSKSVRNFTISFKTGVAADAFSQIAGQYGDTIDKYSKCGLSVAVERSHGGCCGFGHLGL